MIFFKKSAPKTLTFEEFWSFTAAIAESGDSYQFKNYPSAASQAWRVYLKTTLQEVYAKESTRCYATDGTVVILDINPWDTEVFGFPISSTRLVLDSRGQTAQREELVSFMKSSLAAEGVKFITARPCSDDLALINAFLATGFTYIENILWPVLDTKRLPPYEVNPKADYYITDAPEDLPLIKDIARTHQYGKGHFHCEPRLKKSSVSNLYVKWAETSFHSSDQIVVVKDNDTIAGYFVCAIDGTLSQSLGLPYGRLKSLALNDAYRGKKLGMSLFYRTLEVLKRDGAGFIDSGYASKNHTSAYLHSAFGFHSVFEQVTLHAWLG